MTGSPTSPGPDDSAAALSGALDEMAAATDRLLGSVDRLSPAAVQEPSLMPGWTRGHVLTHVARNADAIANLVLAARTGDGRPMYAGGPDSRDAAIAAGAGRHLGDLRLDLAESAERLLSTFADGFPAEARSREVTMRRGATAYGWEIPLIRTREVEIHHVDLDAGYRPEDWSPEFAARTLDQLSPFFRSARDCPVGTLAATDVTGRWEVAAEGPELAGPVTALAGWLVGRSPGRGLSLGSAGDVPPAPRWV
jgi:maleylpyruvate isomerase